MLVEVEADSQNLSDPNERPSFLRDLVERSPGILSVRVRALAAW